MVARAAGELSLLGPGSPIMKVSIVPIALLILFAGCASQDKCPSMPLQGRIACIDFHRAYHSWTRVKTLESKTRDHLYIDAGLWSADVGLLCMQEAASLHPEYYYNDETVGAMYDLILKQIQCTKKIEEEMAERIPRYHRKLRKNFIIIMNRFISDSGLLMAHDSSSFSAEMHLDSPYPPDAHAFSSWEPSEDATDVFIIYLNQYR